MSFKKVRGKKRKLISMIDRIISLTDCFPEEELRYWHMHLPTAESFIDSPKTPKSIRRKSIQTLIDRTVHMISNKPDNIKFAKVVTIISLPTLWDSQIVVFFDKEYYHHFFIRNNSDQQWTLIEDNSIFLKEWDVEIPSGLSIKGYDKIINDEYYYEGQIWAIGEV